MKAAVLRKFGKAPKYEDFPDPVAGEGEIKITVKAVALENIDRAVAQGTHFATKQLLPKLPAIVGSDGIGAREDGSIVGFGGMHPPYGSMAEYAVVPGAYTVPIPAGVDATIAASVPSSALTALFPLKWGVQLTPDQTVLINGATGFAGRLAVQVAKLLGAKRIVGTGRDERSLQTIQALGADGVVDLKQSDDKLSKSIVQQAGDDGYDVILDFLWGHPTEVLLDALTPHELAFARHRIKLVQIGRAAGTHISLAADALRTSGIEIIGGGAGLTPEAMAEGAAQVWEWITAGNLVAEIERVPLKEIERAWKRTEHGKRTVIVL